jgi:hypothetical protein
MSCSAAPVGTVILDKTGTLWGGVLGGGEAGAMRPAPQSAPPWRPSARRACFGRCVMSRTCEVPGRIATVDGGWRTGTART